MPWALKFDGVNDRATMSGTTMHQKLPQWRVEIRLKIETLSGDGTVMLWGTGSGTGGSISIYPGGARIRYSTANVYITGTSLTDDKLYHTIVLTRDASGVHRMEIDGTPTGNTPTLTSTSSSIIDVIGVGNTGNSAQYSEFELEYLRVYNSDVGGSLTVDWDATNSSHAAGTPALTDAIGSNTATGVGMPTDGSAWVDLGGGGTDQVITVSNIDQLAQVQLVDITQFNAINAIICEQVSQSQIIALAENNQIPAIVTEQKAEVSLSAIATINGISPVVVEQLTQSQTVDINESQLAYAVQVQQLTEALTAVVSSDGAQDINVVVTEQKTEAQAVSVNELQQLQAIISEQLTQAVTVTVDESSGILISVVQTEQLTEAAKTNTTTSELISAIVTEQLTQHSTQQINVDLTVDAIVTEQLTQAELVAIIQGEIATSLNIDIDQITLEILTPTYSIESLTPIYTIKHLH